jgi:hypothetical protein
MFFIILVIKNLKFRNFRQGHLFDLEKFLNLLNLLFMSSFLLFIVYKTNLFQTEIENIVFTYKTPSDCNMKKFLNHKKVFLV